MRRLTAVIGLSILGLAAMLAPPSTSAQGPSRGEYLATIMDCSGCHTPGALAGQPDFSKKLAGSSIGFGIPGVGVVYPPNLTPDPDTGIGKWTDEQIARAVRHGQRPDGRILVPIMPWPAYNALTEGDLKELVAYLRTVPAVSNKVPLPAKAGEKPAGPYLTVVQP